MSIRIELLMTVLGVLVWAAGSSPSSYPVRAAEVPISLELDYRSLQPGEIILLTIRSPRALAAAHVRMNDEKFPTVPKDSGPGSARMALIGIDLATEPGEYTVTAAAVLKDGNRGEAHRNIRIAAREFPVKRLRVEQKYVTPPASVLERIRRESQLMRAIYASDSPDWLGTGPFRMPVQGKAFPNFGERRIFNGEPRSPHSGVDISAPGGTPVHAANSGRVVLADDLYYSGNTVVIDHGLGMFTIYCHFSRTRVRRGDMVDSGDKIGEVGATGRVTGPHLHWSVRLRGARVDPFALLELGFE